MAWHGVYTYPRAMVYESAVSGAPVTLSIWFRQDWLGNYYLCSIGKSTSYAEYHYLSTYTGGYLEGGVHHGRARTTTTFSAGTWHHGCAIIGSSTDRRVFLNGGSKGVQTDSVRTYTGMDRIGVGCRACNNSTCMGSFFGELADFAVWDTTLEDEEVLALSSGVSPLLIRPGSLKIYRPLRNSYLNELDSAIDVASYTNGTNEFVSLSPPIWTPRSTFAVPGAAYTETASGNPWYYYAQQGAMA